MGIEEEISLEEPIKQIPKQFSIFMTKPKTSTPLKPLISLEERREMKNKEMEQKKIEFESSIDGIVFDSDEDEKEEHKLSKKTKNISPEDVEDAPHKDTPAIEDVEDSGSEYEKRKQGIAKKKKEQAAHLREIEAEKERKIIEKEEKARAKEEKAKEKEEKARAKEEKAKEKEERAKSGKVLKRKKAKVKSDSDAEESQKKKKKKKHDDDDDDEIDEDDDVKDKKSKKKPKKHKESVLDFLDDEAQGGSEEEEEVEEVENPKEAAELKEEAEKLEKAIKASMERRKKVLKNPEILSEDDTDFINFINDKPVKEDRSALLSLRVRYEYEAILVPTHMKWDEPQKIVFGSICYDSEVSVDHVVRADLLAYYRNLYGIGSTDPRLQRIDFKSCEPHSDLAHVQPSKKTKKTK